MIAVGRPGGKEQLRLITLQPGHVVCGYNVGKDGHPFVKIDDNLPNHMAVVKIQAFSVNHADCCTRWGLCKSENTFVGRPIVPGFDIAGVVEQTSAHLTRVLVPENQLRKVPSNTSVAQAASLPAVSLTALCTLHLGQQHNPQNETEISSDQNNNGILVHSCAGGVGSMLAQMSNCSNSIPSWASWQDKLPKWKHCGIQFILFGGSNGHAHLVVQSNVNMDPIETIVLSSCRGNGSCVGST